MDLHEDRSLVQYFHRLGFDVYIFGHRAGPKAIPPQHQTSIDFDSIVRHDVPAAIKTVRSFSQTRRIHWVGHGFGGQCLVGHLAQDGGDDIGAGALLSSAVHFEPYRATIRRVAAIAERLPQAWRIPTQRIQEILTVTSKAKDLSNVTLRMEGPLARAMLMDATTDLSVGLIQQINSWHKTGHLTDRTNRFDYLEGLSGRDARLLVVGSPSDQFCSPDAAKPVFDKLAKGSGRWLLLPEGWAHLDLIAGADAPRTLFPKVADWLQKHNGRCWTDS